MEDRNCEQCMHKKELGCEKWDCEFEPKSNILYCFKFNPNTFEITKWEITKYQKRKVNDCGRVVYTFRNSKISDRTGAYSVENTKLNRFVSNKVFTFNPDEKRVRRIIESTLVDKYYTTLKQANSYKRLLVGLNIMEEDK